MWPSSTALMYNLLHYVVLYMCICSCPTAFDNALPCESLFKFLLESAATYMTFVNYKYLPCSVLAPPTLVSDKNEIVHGKTAIKVARFSEHACKPNPSRCQKFTYVKCTWKFCKVQSECMYEVQCIQKSPIYKHCRNIRTISGRSSTRKIQQRWNERNRIANSRNNSNGAKEFHKR